MNDAPKASFRLPPCFDLQQYSISVLFSYFGPVELFNLHPSWPAPIR